MCIALTELMLGHGCVHKDIRLVDHPDVSKALGNAGKGPVLGLKVEVAKAEGQTDCIEAQQLSPVHHRRKISAEGCAFIPQASQECCPVLKTRPGERLHAMCIPLVHA